MSRYEAWRMPRGNVVFEMPGRVEVTRHDTFTEAQDYANRLNAWWSARPVPAEFLPVAVFQQVDTLDLEVRTSESRLMLAIETIFQPLHALDLLSEQVRRLAGEELEAIGAS